MIETARSSALTTEAAGKIIKASSSTSHDIVTPPFDFSLNNRMSRRAFISTSIVFAGVALASIAKRTNAQQITRVSGEPKINQNGVDEDTTSYDPVQQDAVQSKKDTILASEVPADLLAKFSRESRDSRIKELEQYPVLWKYDPDLGQKQRSDAFLRLMMAEYAPAPGAIGEGVEMVANLIKGQTQGIKGPVQYTLVDPRFAAGYAFVVNEQKEGGRPFTFTANPNFDIDGRRVLSIIFLEVNPNFHSLVSGQSPVLEGKEHDLGTGHEIGYVTKTIQLLQRYLALEASNKQTTGMGPEELMKYLAGKWEELYKRAKSQGEKAALAASGELNDSMPNTWYANSALTAALASR